MDSINRSAVHLFCDAIQPYMTHLVPLGRAIFARDMGIPCVNGVPNEAGQLDNGELATVYGFLMTVTVGVAEFDLEGLG